MLSTSAIQCNVWFYSVIPRPWLASCCIVNVLVLLSVKMFMIFSYLCGWVGSQTFMLQCGSHVACMSCFVSIFGSFLHQIVWLLLLWKWWTLPHAPTTLNLQVDFPTSPTPSHGFKICLYQHANFHWNHWRNDKVEILNGILEAPQHKFLCNIKGFDSEAWRHMNMFFRSQHAFPTQFLATIHNILYPLPSVFPNTCSIPPFLLYLANCSSNPDVLSTYSKPQISSTQS